MSTEKVIEAEVVEQKEVKQAPAVQSDIKDVVVGSWNDMQRMAKAFSTSALIPQHLQGKVSDVLVILQQAKELNIPPMQALSGINVIKGKPSISPELQLALIKANAPGAFIKIEQDHKEKWVKCTMAPSKDRIDEAFTSHWDMERAGSMGLAGNDNYRKQPMTMLKWRAIGEAARTVFPHITKGLYNTEEIIDLVPQSATPSLKEIFKKEEPSGIEVE